jgi:hypothetical protein
MYALLVAGAAAAGVFVLTTLAWSWVAGILPAILTFLGVGFLLFRRLSTWLEAEMRGVVELLQGQRVDEARTRLESIRARWGRWVPMLDGQIDAQLGMIDYLQLKFDEALPKLERGRFRNWTAEVCIACIHYRRDRKSEAYKAFAAAAATAPKEALVYVVWATQKWRDGDREGALQAVGKGLKELPAHPLLTSIQTALANKKKLDPKTFPQTWYQFWPEELIEQMRMTGRRDGPRPGQPVMPQPRFGARSAPRR